jgi:uncharacterized protein (DUF427 family)
MKPIRIQPQNGQESVWDFPRPARFEPCARHIKVVFADTTIAETHCAIRAVETSHPPSYYVPQANVRMEYLAQTSRRSLCEWKGQAVYFDVRVGARIAQDAAWSYLAPTAPFAAIAGYVAFYPRLMEGCFVDGERAVPQEGGFYGGWITSHVSGPFKGPPGTMGW